MLSVYFIVNYDKVVIARKLEDEFYHSISLLLATELNTITKKQKKQMYSGKVDPQFDLKSKWIEIVTPALEYIKEERKIMQILNKGDHGLDLAF